MKQWFLSFFHKSKRWLFHLSLLSLDCSKSINDFMRCRRARQWETVLLKRSVPFDSVWWCPEPLSGCISDTKNTIIITWKHPVPVLSKRCTNFPSLFFPPSCPSCGSEAAAANFNTEDTNQGCWHPTWCAVPQYYICKCQKKSWGTKRPESKKQKSERS